MKLEYSYQYYPIFRPRWWEIRWRFTMWRWRRANARRRAATPPAVQAAMDDMTRDIERRFFFGDES